MQTRLKLKPGQRGTKRLTEKYGESLVCVRYRYDAATCTRIKTVELVVEKIPWIPPAPKFSPRDLVPVRISYTEDDLKRLAKKAGGRWDPAAKLWFIPYAKIRKTVLEKHIILDAKDKR